MEIVSDVDENRRRIRSEIINCYRIIEGFPMPNWRLDGYMQVLAECKIDLMSKVFISLLRGIKTNKFPAPGWFVDEYNRIAHQNKLQSTVHMITYPVKTESSLRSTAMSHMHLHYNNGWDVSDSQSIKEAYDKIFPGEVYNFNRFKERITKEMVDNYMQSVSTKVAM